MAAKILAKALGVDKVQEDWKDSDGRAVCSELVWAR
jgi:hypothetical protein